MSELRHLAVIMDGNGRWALKRALPRTAGHEKGVEALEKSINYVLKIDEIKYLTVFAFSTENMSRPKEEVRFLFSLMEKCLRDKIGYLKENNIKYLHLGRRDRIPESLREKIKEVEDLTSGNTGKIIRVALDYGGEDEIKRAIDRAISFGEKDFSVDSLLKYSDTPSVPRPDMIIRTGGEKRLSGFLQLTSSYAEILFCDTLWPDWDENMMNTAISDFHGRERRFGLL